MIVTALVSHASGRLKELAAVNVMYMFVTLLVSHTSAWLKASAL